MPPGASVAVSESKELWLNSSSFACHSEGAKNPLRPGFRQQSPEESPARSYLATDPQCGSSRLRSIGSRTASGNEQRLSSQQTTRSLKFVRQILFLFKNSFRIWNQIRKLWRSAIDRFIQGRQFGGIIKKRAV